MKKFVFIIAAFLLLTSCSGRTRYISRMQALEEGVDNPTTVEELKEAIKKYEARAEDLIAAGQKTGIWYKILATRYIDSGMYGEALDALEMAVTYYPANQNLYYYIGVCAGYMAKSSLDFDLTGSDRQQQKYLDLAESGYLRALELEPSYFRALYGIGVLYVFEMNRPADAIPYLEKFVSGQKKDINGMFVLARAYYECGGYEQAVDMYDKIAATTTLDEKKKEALANKQIVLNEAYGSN